MNFFEHQRQAKKNTTSLVFLFFFAVAGIIFMTNIAGWVVIESLKSQSRHRAEPLFTWPSPDQYSIYLAISGVTVFVIIMSALIKKIQMGRDGHGIAQYMGGVKAELLQKQPGVKRALNVVEEMALAAGMTPPPLYILTEEDSINAFAAGLAPQSSVIALSQGCLNHLTRDELQGVVAHELSHILNGDTRLNVQLLGYLAGIVTIGVMGKFVLRSMGRSRYRSRGKDSGGAVAMILFVGVSLWIIGSLGVLVGRMIRSAVSRQREFLADASAVQFTRYPAGIAGALAKIGLKSSKLHFAGAEELSHMCFENPLPVSAFSLYASHPPLQERIARIDKRFLDAQFLASELKRQKPDSTSVDSQTKLTPQKIIDSIGEPTPETLATMGVLMNQVLPQFDTRKSELMQAQALSLALLNRSGQSEQAASIVENYGGKELANEFTTRNQEVRDLDRKNILPCLHQCIPRLRELGETERKEFLKTCEYLVKADSLVDIHEASLFLLVEMHLLEKTFMATNNNRRLPQCKDSAGFLISALCMHGHKGLNEAQSAFEETMQILNLRLTMTREVNQIPLRKFRDVLQELTELNPKHKEQLIKAMLQTIYFDGEINPIELEFMRATSECLGMPIPYEL